MKVNIRGADWSFNAEGSETFVAQTSVIFQRQLLKMQLTDCRRALREYRQWERTLTSALNRLTAPPPVDPPQP